MTIVIFILTQTLEERWKMWEREHVGTLQPFQQWICCLCHKEPNNMHQIMIFKRFKAKSDSLIQMQNYGMLKISQKEKKGSHC